LILWQICLSVFLDFYDFMMLTPGNQYVRRVAMLRPFVMVFEEERLLLSPVRARRGHQDLECPEFILGLSVPQPPAQNVRYLALYT
jgi:hypothetical protein